MKTAVHRTDDWYKGFAEGFNRGCDLLDMALGRKPGKKLTWQQAKKSRLERKE